MLPVEAPSIDLALTQLDGHLPKDGSDVHDVGHAASMDCSVVHSADVAVRLHVCFTRTQAVA